MRALKSRFQRLFLILTGLTLTIVASATLAQQFADTLHSRVVTQKEAKLDQFDWGTLQTYYQGETYGTKDGLTAVAVIKPGMEIHPPHQHAEEEHLMVIEGQGAWHLNGNDFTAHKGDILYAAPWEMHGIKNTGTAPLTFVVWKWNNKALPVPAQPATGNK